MPSKKPSLKEKVEVYESLFNYIGFQLDVAENEEAVEEAIADIREWVNSHGRAANEERLLAAFKKLDHRS